jgi:hypothetical protein
MSGRSAGQLCCVHVSGVGWCISLDVPMLGVRGSFHREPGLLVTTCISFECPARGVGMPVKIFAACAGLVVWDGMGRVLCTCPACPMPWWCTLWLLLAAAHAPLSASMDSSCVARCGASLLLRETAAQQFELLLFGGACGWSPALCCTGCCVHTPSTC